MRVILAKSAGFCYGVERAVKLAEQTARDKGGCVMLGSIIHNAHVVQGLAALGARRNAQDPGPVGGAAASLGCRLPKGGGRAGQRYAVIIA